MSVPEISLIISFYNKIDALRMVLASLELQKFKKFEVIISDDGSSDEIKRELIDIISKSSLDISHVWHEDKGWRKNIALNKAIQASKSNYLLFIDGDCILHPFCLLEHYNHKDPGYVIAGRRVNLSAKITESLNPEKIIKGDLWRRYRIRIFMGGLIKKTRHFENAIYIKSPIFRKTINKKDKGILGSHFSLYKDDILSVNGFDERYLTPAAGEDSDLEFRLRRNGIRIRTLKHIAIQYHLYHPVLFRDKKNLEILRQTIKDGVIYTPYGINKDQTAGKSVPKG